VEDSIIKLTEKENLIEASRNIEKYLRNKDNQVDEEVEAMGDETEETIEKYFQYTMLLLPIQKKIQRKYLKYFISTKLGNWNS